jgi:tetratricopeptide (TPR) repeat protein
VYRASVSKMKSLMSNPNINNAPGIEDVYHGNCSLSGDTDTETYEDNAENTLISEAFQDMIELCLTSFLAVYSPPSPSAVINLFQNCTTTNSTLPKDRIETGENSSVISEVRDEATPNLSHTIASIRHDNQSHDTDTPNPNHVQETLISEQEQGPPDATTPQPQPPIPTSILEPFWCQALYDHFLSSQTHHPLHSTLLQIVSPPTIEVLSSVTAAVQGKYKHLWNNKMTYAAEDEKLKKSLLPLIHIMKEALIHCQILMEEDGQEELCNHQVDEGERIASDKSSNNHPDSSSKSLNKSIKIHPNASEWVNSLSQCYLLRQTRLDAKSERDDRGSKLQSTLGILNLLKWNDLFLSINDSIISSLATSSESKYDADTTMLPSLALDMLTSTKMKGEAPLLMEEKYVAEYMSSHYFRFFSIFLVIPSQVKISFDEFGYGASESFHRNKCRLIHWMTDPNFVHNRLWLHIPRSVTSMDDNTGLRIERQLLENGLLFLDACYKLLVLMLQDKNIPQDDENPYMIFLKIHSIVESYLTTACNIAQSYLEKRAVNMEEKQLDLRDDVSVVKGTRSLQKQRFEKIIKEYRERKKERDSALYDGVELTKQRTVVDTAQSTTPHVRISVPLDEMRSAAERKDSNNMISFSEGGQTETEIDLSNTQFKVNQGWMALKIAIGLGRILHSVAVSLGRSTIDIPASSSNESYKFLATQLEMDLYKKSLSLFESIARFLENHTQLLSSSTAHDEYSDWTTVVSDAKPDGLSNDLKSSDVYIQNQLDIADTLSCMGFAQDTKLQLYEDALLSYKRALDIYSFFMGNKSEAVGKSLHNIAILHVAIAGSINDSLSKKDGYEKADQHREDVRNHYEKSLDAWQSVLQCLESNEQSHQDQPHTVNAQRLEIAGVLHYIAKVYVLLNDEENRIYSLEAGLARIQQSFSGINDDGLELKCNIIAELTDAYFTREDYGKITQLLSNDTLQELSNFFPDRDSREGSWYYYVLGESHFKLRNNELAFRYYFWTLCSIQVLPYVEAFKECGTEDIVNHMLSNSASRSAQIVNFNSPFFDVLEKYELLCATFHFAVLLKNFSKQTLLSEAASPRRLNDLICMFEEIRIKAESYREDCVSNGEEFKSKDLHILIADSFFFTGELCFMSETTISEAADMFTEALEYYQSFQEKFPDPNVSHLSLNNEIIQSENSIVNDHLFVFKQLKTLTYMGHCFRKLYLFDDSMQCYKTALQIQKALCANSNVDVVKKDLEVPEKKLDSSLPSDDLELNLAIADTLSGIGFLYADNSHNHASPHLALRYLEDAAALKQELIPSSSSDVRQTMLLELVKIYELSLSIIEVDVNAYEQSSRDIVSDSTSTSFKDKLCQIYFCLGNVFGLLQRYGDSSESYRRCLAILKASNQGEDLMYGSIMYNYGLVLEKLGGTDNLYYAQNSYEISLAVTEKLLGKSHPVLGDTLHSLGSTILERCLIDQYDTAFQFLSRSLSIRISTLGNEHLKVSQTMFMLARIHFIRGRSERVITLLEKVLQIQRKAHGLDHSSLVDSLELLAEAHVNRRHSKDVKIAISCFREAARIRELISGIQNTSTLSTLTRIAFLHTLNGENTEALNFYEKVLPYYRLAVSENGQSLGHDEIEIDYVHSVVRVLNAMGIIHINLRHNKEAKKFFVEALEVLQKYKLVADISVSEPSATSDESILTLHCLAVILDKIGESNDALQFYRRVIVAYRNYLRSDYLLLAHIASRIGGILIDRYQAGVDTVDKLREAEVYFNEALVTFSSEGESNDQLTGNIHFYLAFVGVRIKCETLVGKKETVEHFYHALNILENPAAEQGMLQG